MPYGVPMTEPEMFVAPDRTLAPLTGSERLLLDSWLDFHRATLLVKCDGLSEDQLKRRSVPPSSLSLLGLVRHMAEVERGWFRRGLIGEAVPPMYYSDSEPDGDFDLVDSAVAAADFATYRAEVEACRAAAATVDDLDAVSRRQRSGNDVSLRWVYLHMIEEYARHNGHADLLRECIDGSTGG